MGSHLCTIHFKQDKSIQGFSSQSHCSQPLHGVLRTKSSKHCPTPPGSGAGLWMIPLSFTRKSTNKASCTHQQCWPCHKVYSGGQQGGWIHPLLGHHCQTRGWWNTINHCVQEPTHTDQYMQWDSHHHLSAKFSVIHTLSHRAKTVWSKPELLQQEKDHFKKLSPKCKYPKWALNKVRKDSTGLPVRLMMGLTTRHTAAQAATNGVKTKGHIVIPYTQGLCESIKKICGRYDIQTHFKSGSTIKNLPQGQRPYGQPKWCYILVPVWWPRLWWWIHRGNLQDLWWKKQGALKGPVSYSSPQEPNRPPHQL